MEKGSRLFDVTVGAFDGAEAYKLVGHSFCTNFCIKHYESESTFLDQRQRGPIRSMLLVIIYWLVGWLAMQFFQKRL